MSAKLDSELARFRDQEDLVSVAVVLDDQDAMRLLAAWRSYLPPAWKRPRAKAPVDLRARWLWVWEPVWVALDLPELAQSCGLSLELCESKLRQCVSARLMYPDGTVSKATLALLQHHVLERTRRRTR